MAIRDRIRNTISTAGTAARGGTGNASRGRRKPAGGFGPGGFGQGSFGQGGFGQAVEDLLSFAGDLRGQLQGRMQGELERLAARLELVTRREFEAVRAIAVAARTQGERLDAQLNGRTAKAAPERAAAKVATVKKPVGKKPAGKKSVGKKSAGKASAGKTSAARKR